MAAATAQNGHPSLVVPESTSQAHQMVLALTRHHRAMHSQITDVAAALRAELPDVIEARGGARTGLFGADAKVAAIRVVRPLMDIARIDDEAARAYVLFYRRWNDLVVNASKNSRPKPRIDVDA